MKLVLLAITFLTLLLNPYATGYGEDRQSLAYWLWHFSHYTEWKHTLMVWPIVGFLIWRARSELQPSLQGALPAATISAIALIAYLLGYRANLYYLGFAAIQLLAAGAVWLVYGTPVVKRLFFAWCFLAFAWPLFFLESRLGFPLRMLVTDLSSGTLGRLGFEHVRTGTALVGEGFALEVADPCSGLRSLFALMMGGALYGHFKLRNSWGWLAMTLAAIPLAIAGNLVRILALAIASRWFGSDFAIGQTGAPSAFHLIAGIAVFLVAGAGMIALSKLADRDRLTPVA